MPRRHLLWIVGLGSAIVVLLAALVVIVASDRTGTPVGAPSSTSTTEAAGTVASTASSPTESAAATATPTTVTTAAPPAADPTTTTTEAPSTTTTTIPPPPCVDAGSIPPAASGVTHGEGDYDGDGSADDFAAYDLGGSWFLWAHLSGGGYRLVVEIDLPWSFEHWDGTMPGPLAVQGPRTLGDARQAAVVRIYAGLGQAYALFAVEGCEIVPFTDASGTIPELYSAMGPSHTEFPVCMEPDAVVQQAELSCPAGGDMGSCASIDAIVTPYTVSRDPARILPDGGGSWTLGIDQAGYQSLLDDSCLGAG